MNPLSFFKRGGETTPNDTKPKADPAGLPFAKMQSVGNDFVVLDESAWPADSDWPKLAIQLCDRHFGIGGDGLLLIGTSDKADLRMRMFNPDGTEDMCGNGLRCVVHLANKRGQIQSPANEYALSLIEVETLSGVVENVIHLDGTVVSRLPPPKFAPLDIPKIGSKSQNVEIRSPKGVALVDSVNTGTTHSVIWTEQQPSEDDFLYWSPQIETDGIFIERTTVLWATRWGDSSFDVRIWERGVGETLGCGTGACAVAVLAKRLEKVPQGTDWIGVHSKGGILCVQWNGGDEDVIRLLGEAHLLYEGIWRDESEKTNAAS